MLSKMQHWCVCVRVCLVDMPENYDDVIINEQAPQGVTGELQDNICVYCLPLMDHHDLIRSKSNNLRQS